MKNRKKGDIAFKFSFSLIFCINAYLHSARNRSVFWKNEMSLSLERLKRRQEDPRYQNDNGSTMRDELRRSKSTFLEVGAYVSLKQATAGLWEGHVC